MWTLTWKSDNMSDNLTPHQRRAGKIIIAFLRLNGPATAPDILKYLASGSSPIELKESELRKIIHRCRTASNPVMVMSGPRGYWVTDDPGEIQKCAESLRSRGIKILQAASNMYRHLKARIHSDGSQQADLFSCLYTCSTHCDVPVTKNSAGLRNDKSIGDQNADLF